MRSVSVARSNAYRDSVERSEASGVEGAAGFRAQFPDRHVQRLIRRHAHGMFHTVTLVVQHLFILAQAGGQAVDGQRPVA
jgi:hypothetical protein